MIAEVINIPLVIGTNVNKAWERIKDQMQEANDGVELYHFYTHGTPTEIEKQLIQRGRDPNNKNKRFPFIALVHNYKTSTASGFYRSLDFTLWIMNLSQENASYANRYADNFMPFLLPIWQAVLNELERSGHFHIEMGKGVEHDMWERPNWGKYNSVFGNEANILGERIDGVEANIKGLRMNYSNCLRTTKENRIITN